MTSSTHFGASLPFAISNPDDQRVFEDGAGWKAAMLLVRRKAMMIFLITVLTSLAAVPIILLLPKHYSAETRFMVSPTHIFKFAEDATGRMPALDINIGSGVDIPVRELAGIIAKIVGFRGHILTDPSKPDGTQRKLLDNSRLAAMGWRPKINLEDGLRATYKWYIDNAAEVRA